MTPTLLFLRGSPGVGKISVARILSERLGWKLLWLHDLDPIWRIVGKHNDPRFIDQISTPVIHRLLSDHGNLIYVRPARDRESVERQRIATLRTIERFVVVRLTGTIETLLERVVGRITHSEFRIRTEAALTEYLEARPEEAYPGEHELATDGRRPGEIATIIQQILEQGHKP